MVGFGAVAIARRPRRVRRPLGVLRAGALRRTSRRPRRSPASPPHTSSSSASAGARGWTTSCSPSGSRSSPSRNLVYGVASRRARATRRTPSTRGVSRPAPSSAPLVLAFAAVRAAHARSSARGAPPGARRAIRVVALGMLAEAMTALARRVLDRRRTSRWSRRGARRPAHARRAVRGGRDRVPPPRRAGRRRVHDVARRRGGAPRLRGNRLRVQPVARDAAGSTPATSSGCVFYFALLAAAAGEVTRYWQASREAAVLDERRRIARDLHDGLAQELAFIVRRANRALGEGPAPPDIAQIANAAERALDESRRVIADADAAARRAARRRTLRGGQGGGRPGGHDRRALARSRTCTSRRTCARRSCASRARR